MYISPGIGISQAISVDNILENIYVVYVDDSRFTWQIKGGVSFPISRKFDLFGQLRYASQSADNTVDFFGTEIGVDFQF
ncbi:MAG: hypothetical protein ACFCU7_14130 [Pleurocapsa sp.]